MSLKLAALIRSFLASVLSAGTVPSVKKSLIRVIQFGAVSVTGRTSECVSVLFLVNLSTNTVFSNSSSGKDPSLERASAWVFCPLGTWAISKLPNSCSRS
ncbi:hypothetical protein Dimus_038065 [Dionaea muscipula]